MTKAPPFKTVAAMMLGFLLAVGRPRLGRRAICASPSARIELMRGFDFLVAVIGLFGIGEILLSMEEKLALPGRQGKDQSEAWCCKPGRSCRVTGRPPSARALVGCWMGITPGGATPASFMSYGLAKRFSKNGANFGKGEVEGVFAPETGAHAAGTAACCRC